MAANTSFKVQCPSCEAQVSIRDPNLVGKKIDCPKCKYRFVVEDPGTADDEVDDRPARKGAAGRQPAAKLKPKKKAGSNNMVILGSVLGVVALAVLGVGGWLLFFNDSGRPTPASPHAPFTGELPTPLMAGGSGGGGAPPVGSGGAEVPPNPTPTTGDAPTPPGGTPTPGGEQPTAPALPVPASAAGDITNLLPNDSQTVVVVHVDRLRNSTLGQQAFESRVGFKPETFRQKFGLGIEEISRMVRGENLDQGWAFNVIRAGRPVSVADFQGPLGLTKGPKSPIQGREYYTIAPNDLLDHLGTILQSELESKESKAPPKTKTTTGPLAFLLLDAMTVVIGHQDPMEEFLQNGAKFPALSQVSPAPGGGGDQPPGGGGDLPTPVIGGGGGGGTAGGGESPELAAGFQQPPGRGGRGGGGRGGRGGGGNPGGDQGNRPPRGATQFTNRGTFLTIEPNLKAMLDHLEGNSQQPVLTLAQRLQSNAKVVERVRDATGFKELEVGGMDVLGVALYQLNVERFRSEIGVLFFREATAKGFEDGLREVLPLLANAVGLYLGGLRVDVSNAAPPGPGMGPGMGGGGGTAPGGGDLPSPAGTVGGGGGGMAGADDPAAPPGGRGQPGQNQGPRSTMSLSRQGRSVFFSVDLGMTERAYDRVYALTESAVVRMKGLVDMADPNPHWHELAAAGVAVRKDGSFPRGTFPRDETVGKWLSRTWPPNHRVGWMVNLLPYLGQDELFQRIDKKKSWRDEENLQQGTVLIPQFLNPRYPRPSWRAAVPSLGLRDQGATHFVGVAGVGVDAADYSATDPAVAKKLGIFGYDRRTSVADISDGDGLGNTIMMLQVPPNAQRPWIAGGGATITGVPEAGSVKPFVATQADGKRGTYALMADGSVRFIGESISDEVFKALCTYKGGESIDDLDQKAPKVDRPKGAELKTGGVPTAGTPGTGAGGR